jgi:hypothetical protein
VRFSFANKKNSTTRGWGLGAWCLCVQPELSPCVHLKITRAAEKNIPVVQKKTLSKPMSVFLPSLRLKEPQAKPASSILPERLK